MQLRIFRHPQPDRRYVIGGDVAQGLAHGDDSTAQVLDRLTGEQAAEFQGKMDPDEYGDFLAQLGQYYNWAYIGVENNADLTPIYTLKGLEYPNLHYQCVVDGRPYDRQTDKIGWNTNSRTRAIMVSTGRQMLKDGSVRLYSNHLLDQMEVFARNQRGRFEAIPGAKDDLVMGWLIACQMLQWVEVVDDWRARGHVPKLVIGTPPEAEVEDGAEEGDDEEPEYRTLTCGEKFDRHIARRGVKDTRTTMGGLIG